MKEPILAFLLVAGLFLVTVAGVRYVAMRDPVPVDHFFAQAAAAAPDYTAARSIYKASEVPMVVVSGRGFEGCEVRLKFHRVGPAGAELVSERAPARLAAGSFYAVKLPGAAPGVFRVDLLRNGETVRQIEIKVAK
jgi:hypothetical protein